MSLRLSTVRHILNPSLIVISTILLASCAQHEEYPVVRFSQVEPAAKSQPTEVAVLQVALATGLSPSQSLARYQAITDYLSAKLGQSVELLQRKTYAEVDDLLRDGKVDIAFVCSSSYVIGRDAFGERLVAVPVIRGASDYHSVIVVNAASSITAFDELKGKSMALADPQSASGALYLYSKVAQFGGLTWLKSFIYTYSHDYSIVAVRDGLVDGAAVDSNVLATAIARDPQLNNALRIIDTSPAYANNPVVAKPGLDPALFDQVQTLLLGMNSNPDGQAALTRAGMDRFILLDNTRYDSVRQLIQKAKP